MSPLNHLRWQEILRDPGVESRFWDKVDMSKGPYYCWPWLAGTTEGYGMFNVGEGLIVMSHRISFMLDYGYIPPGYLYVPDHVCTNKLCQNYYHLELVPNGENSRRSPNTVTGINARKDACIHGHSLFGHNLYVDPEGKRRCKRCRANTEARRRLFH